MNNNYYDELYILYNKFENTPKQKRENHNCIYCLCELIIMDGFYPTCPKCGSVHTFLIYNNESQVRKTKSIYKRKQYFAEKVNIICGYKECNDDNYNWILTEIQLYNEEIKTIYDLRNIMKKLKMFKFYDYAYNIFFHLKNIRIIHLTKSQIETLITLFIKFEIVFKKINNKLIKKNILPLSFIIMKLMNKIGIKDIEHVNTIKMKSTLQRCENIWSCCHF